MPAVDGRSARKVLVVCSNGGHLAQLMRLRPWWGKHDRAFVTFEGDDSAALLAGEQVYWAYFPTSRSAINLLRNTWLSIRVLRRERPDVIVSNGAGVAVPFFYVGRLIGIPTVFIEVFDRVVSASLTGRLCGPVTSLLLLQWDDQRVVYGRGEVVGPLY
jgi:UDP-N-acetylglucosamine:LPS N-acetylglucosamine transferase